MEDLTSELCLRQGVVCYALHTPNINIEERGIGVAFVPNLGPFSMAEREPSLHHLFDFIIEVSIIAIASLFEASSPQIFLTCNMLGSRKAIVLTVNAIIIF
jgi:hypothetical protein